MNVVLSLSSNQLKVETSFSGNDFLIFSEANEEKSFKNGFSKIIKKRTAVWKQISYQNEKSCRDLTDSQKTSPPHNNYLDYHMRFGSKKRASYRFIDINDINANSCISTITNSPRNESKTPLKIKKIIKKSKSSTNSITFNRSQSCSSHHLDYEEDQIQTRALEDTFIASKTQPSTKKSEQNNHPIQTQIEEELTNKETLETYKISPSLLNLIQLKFCLYLQSEYKVLKSSNITKQKSIMNQQIYQSLFEKNNKNQINPKQENSESMQIINSSSQKKAHNFNMSKYFMVFLIRLFDQTHLEELDVDSSIVQFLGRFMNDFERLNPSTFIKISQNTVLLQMHLRLFQVSNIKQQETWTAINIFKESFARIALAQLDVLAPLSNHNLSISDFLESQKLDFSSKIQYMHRVKKAIAQLRYGRTVYRF